MILANGFNFYYFTASSDANTTAHPPSLIFEAFPAVIVPVLANTAFNNGILSLLYLIYSSSSLNKVGLSFGLFYISMSAISFFSFPDFIAAISLS